MAKFTKTDFAKYPFLKETTDYVRDLSLKIEDLTSPELAEVLERAQDRIEEAILYTAVTRKTRNADIEILSFPAAIMLVIATENSLIKKRYALAEAKSAQHELELEPRDRILAIAQNFAWNLLQSNDHKIPCEFKLHFTDYLRNTTRLRDKEWKLVNRPLSDGYVYLGRNETARLLSEEVRSQIEKRLAAKDLPKFPPTIMEKAEKLKKLASEKIGQTEIESFPKTVTQTAFPPCIQVLYQAVTSKGHLSHIGRFTLTSFLVNVGMPPENVIGFFKSFSDYNQRMTSYQVEHIAGEKGSRTQYKPPKCETLKTHGICVNPDELCRRIHHPLAYYKRKIGKTK